MSDISARLTAALADRYRIERELGEGGMATVYLAHDLKHDRDVAEIMAPTGLASANGWRRTVAVHRTPSITDLASNTFDRSIADPTSVH